MKVIGISNDRLSFHIRQAICVGAQSMGVRTHSSGQEKYLFSYMTFEFKDERIDL